jgi:hypothetical protein
MKSLWMSMGAAAVLLPGILGCHNGENGSTKSDFAGPGAEVAMANQAPQRAHLQQGATGPVKVAIANFQARAGSLAGRTVEVEGVYLDGGAKELGRLYDNRARQGWVPTNIPIERLSRYLNRRVRVQGTVAVQGPPFSENGVPVQAYGEGTVILIISNVEIVNELPRPGDR